ncbi:MAG: ROK family transcriptional regulator [Nocardioidaceae bacterium]|nr:ROK family transcriptional regulator [Nocardioidaceae bacterium]
MRRANLALILRHLQRAGSGTRSRIALETGLSKATLSNLVVELIDRHLVREDGPDRGGGVGRPGLTVSLDGRAVAGVGVEIDSEYAAVSAVDLQGTVIRETEAPVDVVALGPEATLDRVARLIGRTVLSLTEARVHVAGITVSAPGVIDYTTGTLRFAPNLGWRDIPLVERLTDRFSQPFPQIALENDAKLAAIAEYASGYQQQGVEDLVYLAGQAGIGAGIVANGQLVRGWSGFSGEVGHLPLDPTGRPCACGRTGCWEGLIGLRALLRRAADDSDPIHDPRRLLEDRLTELHERAVAGDARVLEAIHDVATDLSRGMSIVVDVLNPEVVVLGGYFAILGDLMLEPVRAGLATRRMDDGSAVRVEPSRLGMTSTSLGGAIAALEEVFRDPLLVPVQARG